MMWGIWSVAVTERERDLIDDAGDMVSCCHRERGRDLI